jgi:hypothetical protein
MPSRFQITDTGDTRCFEKQLTTLFGISVDWRRFFQDTGISAALWCGPHGCNAKQEDKTG